MDSQLIRIVNCTIVVPLVILCLASCSVKEDRRVCPCILEVGFYDRESIEDPVLLVGWSSDELFDVKVNIEDYPDIYSRKTPRTMLSFGAVKGVVHCRRDGHTLMIPQGYECDSIYSYCDYIDCTGETAHTKVLLHKQFSTVYLGVTNPDFNPAEYSFFVSSNSCGIDLLTCDAKEGEFSCIPACFGDKRYSYRIPRQSDDSMTLTVTHKSGDDVVFPLGSLIKSIGYDWKSLDLQDIYITLDIARGRVGVGVAGWESVEDFELSTVEI